MAGLIVQGRSSYPEVDLFRNDLLFQQALDFDTVFAPETIQIYKEKIFYTGVLTGYHPKAEEHDELPDIDQIYQVTIRSIDKKRQRSTFPRD